MISNKPIVNVLYSLRLTSVRRSGSIRKHAAAPAAPTYEIVRQPGPDGAAATVARYVQPYISTHTVRSKEHWLGRELLEVLSTEFGSHHPLSYWQQAIAHGQVRVNDRNRSPTYRLQHCDQLMHRAHRHEPPVFGRVHLVGETDTLMAVSKTPSMPMHAGGAYLYNTLESVLAHEPLVPRQPGLHLVHRLDRVTSGLCILAKSKQAAARMSLEIRSKETTKIYLARVRGRFPADLSPLQQWKSADLHMTADDANSQIQRRRGAASADEGTHTVGSHGRIPSREEVGRSDRVGYVVSSAAATASAPCIATHDADDAVYQIHCPLSVVSAGEALSCCDPSGKASLSVFRSLGYCPLTNTSLVECRPITGRTHQLRLHLQLCGNPIANDQLYGGKLFYGNEARRARAINTLLAMRSAGMIATLSKSSISGDEELDTILKDQANASSDEDTDMQGAEDESDDAYLVRTCKFCKPRTNALSRAMEQLLHADGIWLHAFQYSGSDWSFTAEVPVWAEQFLRQGSTIAKCK